MNDLVYMKNDEAVCDSLQVAKKFEKRHDNVMQAIRGLLKNKETHEMFTKIYDQLKKLVEKARTK